MLHSVWGMEFNYSRQFKAGFHIMDHVCDCSIDFVSGHTLVIHPQSLLSNKEPVYDPSCQNIRRGFLLTFMP